MPFLRCRAFDATPGAATTYHALLCAKRVPLVVDLDETCLQAVTLRAFDERCDAVAKKAGATQDATRRQALECDLGRLLADRALLQEYAAQDAVTVGGARVVAVPEPVDEDGIGSRPVIRLPDGVVMTRIDPGRRETSMLVRLRPGWESLRAYLAGEEPGSHSHQQQQQQQQQPPAAPSAPRPRFDVFVCTLSERGYAREMWRLLDPNGRLIPPHLRAARIVSTPPDRQKHLREALGNGKEAAMAACALVVDDRPSVWAETDQAHVLAVPPFLPYAAAETAAGGNSAADSAVAPWPLQAARSALEAARGGLYRYIDTQFVPRCAALTADMGLQVLRTGSGSDPSVQSLPPLPSGWEALRPHRERVGTRPQDAPVHPPPGPAGDPWRGDLSAVLAAAAGAAPAQSAAAARFTSAAIAAASVPPAAGMSTGRSSSLSTMQLGGVGQPGLPAGVAPVEVAYPVGMPAPDSAFQALRLEVERRGGTVDWDCRYDLLGDLKVFTATPYISGVPLLSGQGPDKRTAQEAAATASLAKLKSESGEAASNGRHAPAPGGGAALGAAALARMVNLAGAPGGDKQLSPALAVSTLSVYWERLESSQLGATSPPSGPVSLEYRLLEPAAPHEPGGAAPAEVTVQLWAGRPPRAIASGSGPGRKEATQRAALAALRQEGFVIPEEVLQQALDVVTVAAPPAAPAPPARAALDACVAVAPPAPVTAERMEHAGGDEAALPMKRKAEDEPVAAA